MSKPNNTLPETFSFLNGAESFQFPVQSNRYSLAYGSQGVDSVGGFASFESAMAEARSLLQERAEWVTVYDNARGFAVAKGSW